MKKRAGMLVAVLVTVGLSGCATGVSRDLPTCSGKPESRRPLNPEKWPSQENHLRAPERGTPVSAAPETHASC